MVICSRRGGNLVYPVTSVTPGGALLSHENGLEEENGSRRTLLDVEATAVVLVVATADDKTPRRRKGFGQYEKREE